MQNTARPDFDGSHWLHHLYMQAPVAIGSYIGKEHIIEFANPPMCELWGRSIDQVINKPLFQALPEVSQQGFEEILSEVLRTGTPFSGNELPATLKRKGRLDLAYFNILYKPLRDAADDIIGIIQVATEVTEQVVARKKAEKNEEVLKVALEAGRMGTWFIDYINNSSIERSVQHDRIFGYQDLLPEWNFDSFLDHVLPEDRPLVKENFQQSLTTGVLDYELRIRQPNNTVRWVHMKGGLSFNLKGKPISSSGIIMDITESKKEAEKEKRMVAEYAAREEAERQSKILHNLFMNAPALICTLLGPEHTFDLVNLLYQQLFHGRELQGKPILTALPELERQPFIDILNSVYNTGKTFIGNEVPLLFDRLNTGNLETGYFNFSYQPMLDAAGTIFGILVFAFEVTAQVVAMQHVESSEENLQMALEAGRMGTYNLDILSDNCVRSLHHDRIFGYDKLLPEWGYNKFKEHLLPEDHIYVDTQFQYALQFGKLKFEARIETTDNQLRWVAVKGKTIYKNGQAVRMLGVIMDITERKQAEATLQQLTSELASANQEILANNEKLRLGNEELSEINKQLETVNADLDTFVYAASHDLKSPVVSLQSLLTFFTRKLTSKLDEKEQEMLNVIQLSADRLHKTIQDLTQIARIQRNTDEEKEKVYFSNLLSEIEADIHELIKESEGNINASFEVESIVYARKHIRSILYNLISNGLKYRSTDRVPQINISTHLSEGKIILTIADNGLGLSAKQVDNLFTMFKRFHDHVEGSGVGLYMIKRIIENNGGKIEVESELGKGTTFRVYF